MTEYIDRESLLREFDELEPYEEYESEHALWLDMRMEVINAPAADVAPVVHGQWITEFDDLGWLKHTCTVCGYTKRTDVHVSLGWNYCPNCGARMDGGED